MDSSKFRQNKTPELAAAAQYSHADSGRALLPKWALRIPYQVFEMRSHSILAAPVRPYTLVTLDTAEVRL
jgi:hypothetical protein